MLGHAPPPLAVTGLDIRGGHPVGSKKEIRSALQVEVLTPRRRVRRNGECNRRKREHKPPSSLPDDPFGDPRAADVPPESKRR